MSDSTRKSRRSKSRNYWEPIKGVKVRKPYQGFPISPHPSGKWQKKLANRTCYFGNWARRVDGKLVRIPGDGWQQALELYRLQSDDLIAGRSRRTNATNGTITVKELCNEFHTAKRLKMESGELAARTFMEYREAIDLIVAAFGKNRSVDTISPLDFQQLRAAMSKRWGPVRLGKFVSLVRIIFRFGSENLDGMLPVRFGSEFRPPKKEVLKREKRKAGKRLFTADEIRQCLDHASPWLRAAILLGIGNGLGNSDISGLQREHLDLDARWLHYDRPKTGESRKSPIWVETADAIRVAMKCRPKAKDKVDRNRIFLNRLGSPMVQATITSHSDYVTAAFGKLLRKLKIDHHRGFYALRHTFATVALQTGDRDAVKACMGHASRDMLSVYDESGPDNERLLRVSQFVHDWLFAEGGER